MGRHCADHALVGEAATLGATKSSTVHPDDRMHAVVTDSPDDRLASAIASVNRGSLCSAMLRVGLVGGLGP